MEAYVPYPDANRIIGKFLRQLDRVESASNSRHSTVSFENFGLSPQEGQGISERDITAHLIIPYLGHFSIKFGIIGFGFLTPFQICFCFFNTIGSLIMHFFLIFSHLAL